MSKMNAKYFSITTFFIIILLAVSVNAVTPDVKYKVITDSVNVNDTSNPALYSLTITNSGALTERYQLYTISAFWNINPTIVIVPAGEPKTFTLEIALNDKQIYGPQLVPITIKSLSSDDTVVENFYVYVKPLNYTVLSYVPNVAMEVNTKYEVDPREPISIEVYMRNRNPLNIKDLRIIVESPLLNKEYLTTLGPLDEKTNQILFTDISKIQEPGKYPIIVRIVTQNKTIAQVQKEVQVIGYSEVTVEQTKIRGLFSYTEKIKVHNNGNYEATKLVKVQKNFFEKIFTSTSAKYVPISEDGIGYLSWNIPLKPQESYELTISTNYNIIAIIVIIIIALIILYYIFRSPVLLFKRARILSSNDDGISEIRVKLHLKNRSGQVIRNIKVIDKYPKIVSLVEDNSLGALKPTKMLSADKVHSLLMWNLESLEPYEERLLSYTVRSRLNIVGNLSLHAAKVRFQSPAGERTHTSNDVTLKHKSENVISYD